MMKKLNRLFWINFGLFELCWLTAVIGAGIGYAYLSILALLLFIGCHFFLIEHSYKKVDALLLTSCLFIGFCLDTYWVNSDFLIYAESWPSIMLAPYWILVLWCAFALTFNHSMRWMQKYPVLTLLLIPILSALSYRAGIAFGAVTFLPPTMEHYVILNAVWGPVVYLILHINFYIIRHYHIQQTDKF